jgi:hypothetical protein
MRKVRPEVTPKAATPNIAAVHAMPFIRVYDAAGAVIETHQHEGDLRSGEHETKQKAATR